MVSSTRARPPEVDPIAVMSADIRWVGNEAGIAPAGTASVQTRNGTPVWYPAECDVSIRPGWFHHDDQDGQVKSLNPLLNIYFQSVGRNCPLLLDIPPDKRGLIAAPDVTRMMELGAALDNIFRTNHPRGQAATADSVFAEASAFTAARAVDDDLATYWAAADGETTAGDRSRRREELHRGQHPGADPARRAMGSAPTPISAR